MTTDLLQRLRSIIDDEPRIQAVGEPIAVSVELDGSIALTGDVATVAAKRLACSRVCSLPDVLAVVDRLRVVPDRRVGDEQIRRRLLDLMFHETAFGAYELSGSAPGGRRAKPRSPSKRGPHIHLDISDGIVALNGRAESGLHKQLAGVLAWWTPGSRDVHNELVVDAPQTEGDSGIELAVRSAIEKDPLLDAALEVAVRDGVVVLRGSVASGDERDAAEADAWYVIGVSDVVNEIALAS